VRRALIAGNWKMNLLMEEVISLIEGILQCGSRCASVDVLICPPFPYLERAVAMTLGTEIQVGAQNVYHEKGGAFTGEVSAPMLRSLRCSHVIVGHSERRALFQEKNDEINRKLKSILHWGLAPILCIGESLEQRRAGVTRQVLNEQLVYGMQGIDNEGVGRIVVAYEPVWAIGTGMSATSGQVQETHRFIRETLSQFSHAEVAGTVRVIYGGSVNPDNAAGLLEQEDVDGVLVGGASLNAESFCAIVERAVSTKESDHAG
jgi:triosephosphate isomerase